MSASIIVDMKNPTPPYEQIRKQIVALIESGILESGQRLPTVRQLASDLQVASGTVARAYKELESAGLIVTRRAAGTRVAGQLKGGGAKRSDRDEDRYKLDLLAEAFVGQARNYGASGAEIAAAVEKALVNKKGGV
ncbi:GntR family transcriptional regulator [Schaalia vaccimaxillae]|uniref:GntR family transcriptional regulator n=1 Tax=Schaalia vaccimaxillae TaxID=183916 RepID=UPI0003B65E52|nr:GntR family transcriptional regulator [Schaalia vaccimaxillae]